jgi:O-antigen ligase
MFVGIWWMPLRSLPWTWFHAELLAGATLLLGLLVALRGSPQGRLAVPRTAAVVAVLAVVPWAQWATGLVWFAGDALLATLFLVGVAAAIVCGHALVSQRHALGWAWVWALAAAGVGSALMALWQAAGGHAVSGWLHASAFESRSTANLGQPNLLATLLVWSLLAALALHHAHKLGRWPLALCSLLVLAGLATTRSRTGLLELALLAIAFASLKALRRGFGVVGWLVIAAPVAVLALAVLGPAPAVPAFGPVGDGSFTSASVRVAGWQTLAAAAGDRPWLGWGWGQVSVAQALSSAPRELGVVWDHAHNLLLDLIIWNGVPLGVALFVLLLAWFWHQWRRCTEVLPLLAWLGMATFGLHAMLEMPHSFFSFLLPVGLAVGGLAASHAPSAPRWHLASPAAFAALFSGVVALSAWVQDYAAIEGAHARLLPASALAGGFTVTPEPMPIHLASHVHARLSFLEQPLPTPADTVAWQQAERVALRFGDLPVMLRWARAQAHAGRPEEMQATLERLCRTQARVICDRARRALQPDARMPAPP